MAKRNLTRRTFLHLGLGALATSHFMLSSRERQALAQTEESLLVPVKHVELPPSIVGGEPWHATGMWARGTLAGVPAGSLIHLIEFSDPQNPQVTTIDIRDIRGDCRDIDFYENFLVCGLVRADDRRRVLIYDISDWKNPKLVSTVQSSDYGTVHNVFVSEKVCFLPTIGRGQGELFMVDLTDPAHPLSFGPVEFEETTPTNVHDVTVIGNRLYAAAWDTGFWIIDFENLDNPQQLSYTLMAHHDYGRGFSHNIWPSPDGKLAFTSDEAPGEPIRIFDISDLSNIQQLGQYSNGNIPHNVVVDGAFGYVAYYANGVRVFEYSNPQEPKEVAAFDPYGGRSRFRHGFDGFWDVYPFGKYVLGSDMRSGMWILEKRGVLAGGNP